MENMKVEYQKKLNKQIQDKLKLDNPMATPRITKIILNMGVRDAVADKKNIDRAEKILAQISGQKARVNRARKSIASFKLRQGDAVGVSVTLRDQRMYDFYQKLVAIVLPRLKDFRGVSRKSFDGRGNYTIGFSEYSVFPEIDPSTVERAQGLEVVITTTAKDNEQGMVLLETLGMPFEKEAVQK